MDGSFKDKKFDDSFKNKKDKDVKESTMKSNKSNKSLNSSLKSKSKFDSSINGLNSQIDEILRGIDDYKLGGEESKHSSMNKYKA